MQLATIASAQPDAAVQQPADCHSPELHSAFLQHVVPWTAQEQQDQCSVRIARQQTLIAGPGLHVLHGVLHRDGMVLHLAQVVQALGWAEPGMRNLGWPQRETAKQPRE